MGESSHESHSGLSNRQILIISLVLLFLGLGGTLFAVRPQWYQNYAPKQPIPFSHKVHAGVNKIPCYYCHQSAESSAHAGVPGLETCMNCHTQVKTESPYIQEITKAYNENRPIAWVKVHVLPDFVHFEHHKHIKAGVQCQTCHGPVEEMDVVYQWAGLHMGWCMNCHRNDDYLQDHRIEFSRKTREMQGLPAERSKLEKMLGQKDPHNADVSCQVCHY